VVGNEALVVQKLSVSALVAAETFAHLLDATPLTVTGNGGVGDNGTAQHASRVGVRS